MDSGEGGSRRADRQELQQESEARGSERTKKRYPELIRTANKPQSHQYSVPDSSKPMNLFPHNARLQLIERILTLVILKTGGGRR